MSDLDEKFMRTALRLAARGKGTTSPNPRVGALVVKKGAVVSRGWHKRTGEPHAEVIALRGAGQAAAGSTLYVTLEPCSSEGRTPPCTDQIVAAGVKRVVVGATDPWPAHCGRGFRILRRKGIEVTRGLLEAQSEKLNEGFYKFVSTGFPFVTVKAALSLDGRIATSTGESKWISNERSRQHAHRLRNESDAIIVGVGTVRRDNPSLTVRGEFAEVHSPWKVVVDSRASVGLPCKLLSGESASRTILATTRRAPQSRLEAIASTGAEIVVCGEKQGKVSLRDLMRRLAKRGILYVLIEGGSQVITSALEAGVVDKVAFFYAPKIIGGAEAPSVVEGKGARRITKALAVNHLTVRRFGTDVLIEGYVAKKK
jgi:diaminohydroxyphosphoribosylaminopyrimidine deaminase/5-amino-6-(5-phosphoribosylamino)uracil reductase